jgi:hypothetical protein
MIFNITNEQAGNILWAVKTQGERFPDEPEWKPLYDEFEWSGNDFLNGSIQPLE